MCVRAGECGFVSTLSHSILHSFKSIHIFSVSHCSLHFLIVPSTSPLSPLLSFPLLPFLSYHSFFSSLPSYLLSSFLLLPITSAFSSIFIRYSALCQWFQMDGVGSSQGGILVLGATNVPWELDPGMEFIQLYSRVAHKYIGIYPLFFFFFHTTVCAIISLRPALPPPPPPPPYSTSFNFITLGTISLVFFSSAPFFQLFLISSFSISSSSPFSPSFPFFTPSFS